MAPRSVPMSYQVVELVREAISTAYARASDAGVARALGITPGAVAAYKSGRDTMSAQTLMRADAFMKLYPKQLAEVQVRLAMESTKDPDARRVWAAIIEMIAGKAAAVIVSCLLLAGLVPNQAHASAAGTTSRGQSIHYAKYGRRLRRWLASLLRRSIRPIDGLLTSGAAK